MYSEQELEQQPLIDDDQWGRLESELGLEMLQEFAQEFFEETREIWFVPGFELVLAWFGPGLGLVWAWFGPGFGLV